VEGKQNTVDRASRLNDWHYRFVLGRSRLWFSTLEAGYRDWNLSLSPKFVRSSKWNITTFFRSYHSLVIIALRIWEVPGLIFVPEASFPDVFIIFFQSPKNYVKRLGREADHSSPSSAEVRNPPPIVHTS
jgi:hypothetical protein